jgi:Domain of unknown function (DUF222)
MFVELIDSLTDKSYDECNALLQELDALTRRTEALKAAVVATVHATKAYRADGQHATTTWLRSTLRCSTSEALRLHKLAALCCAVPAVGEALLGGDIPIAAAHDLGSVYANRRVREQFTNDIDNHLGGARQLEHRDFHQSLRRWELLADRDGAHRAGEQRHARRHGSITTVNYTTNFHIELPDLEGLEARELFERFIAEELTVDFDEQHRAEQVLAAMVEGSSTGRSGPPTHEPPPPPTRSTVS